MTPPDELALALVRCRLTSASSEVVAETIARADMTVQEIGATLASLADLVKLANVAGLAGIRLGTLLDEVDAPTSAGDT